MIDTHAHIDFNAFDDDRDIIIKKAIDNGLEAIIVPGVEPKDYKRLLDLTSSNDNIYCGLGVHPHNANDASDDVFEKIVEYSKHEKVKAIGETGIDYFYDFAPKDKQQEVFRRQLQIAKVLDLPAIIHNREADDDILRIVKEEQDGNLKGVLHCFSSGINVMEEALALGLHISFTGNITFKKSNLTELVKQVPLDKIMLETDSPFMTPVPNRGKRNEPSNVRFIAEKIAEIKSISINEVTKMTTKTAKQLFKLTALLIMFFVTNFTSFSQSSAGGQVDSSDMENEIPYRKFIGIGPFIGGNTVVETYFLPGGKERDISYDGLLTYGGAAFWGVFDYLVIEAGYNYSKNTKIVEEQNGLVAPTIYQTFEFTSHWIVNPYSRINFFGSLGLNYFMNSHNKVPNKQLGWNSGVGFYINLPTNIGLVNLAAEWRINFEIEKKEQLYSDRNNPPPGILLPSKSFYSIPRVYLIYYPSF